jgi:hypothetical protein
MLMAEEPYQLLFLGSADVRRTELQNLIASRTSELGLPVTAVRLIEESNAASVDPGVPLMGIFFGGRGQVHDRALINDLLEQSIVIAPLVSRLTEVHNELPPQLRGINAIDEAVGIERVATLVLETFRLLRRERRLFISYRRVDSEPLANRLYDALDARGFDVFIDVRSVPPAVDFQSQLWHRMSDSDVIVLIDTPGFRASRWTTQELAQANATNIQILHLLWLGQEEDPTSAFSHFMHLNLSDFIGWLPLRGRWIRGATISHICDEVERLRARAIAARFRYLIDNFCDLARDEGMAPAVQPDQWVSVSRTDRSRHLVVVPAVGIPTSDRIHQVFDAVPDAADADMWVIFDNRGVLSNWLAHLEWLDMHLPIRTVQMARAPDLLREFNA